MFSGKSFGVVLTFLISLFVYSNTLSNGFVYDDVPVVLQNGRVVEAGEGGTIFITPSWSSLEGEAAYRPLVTLSFNITYRLFGPSAAAFHAGNVLLHALAVVLMYVWLLRLGVAPLSSLLGALLFALHPVHAEPVASIANRTELLAAVFFMASLILYQSKRIFLSAACFLAALMSKESAVTLLGVIPAMDWLQSKVGFRPKIKNYWPHLAAFAVYFAVRHMALGGLGLHSEVANTQNNPLLGLGAFSSLMNALRVDLHYLGLLIFPWKLSADYSYNQFPMEAALSAANLGAAAVWAALAAGMFYLAKRSKPAAFFAFFGAATFSIVSNWIIMSGSIFAERLIYLPSLAFCVLAAMALSKLIGRFKGLGWAAACALCVLYAGRAYARNRDWRDQLSLFESAASVCPRSMKALHNYGEALNEAGKAQQALPVLERAIAIDPARAGEELWSSLATAQMNLQDFEGARAAFERALQKNPEYANAHFGLGYIYFMRRDWPKAESYFRQAARLMPESEKARAALSEALLRQGKTK